MKYLIIILGLLLNIVLAAINTTETPAEQNSYVITNGTNDDVTYLIETKNSEQDDMDKELKNFKLDDDETSSSPSVIPVDLPDLTSADLYNLILEDKCSERWTDIKPFLVASPFKFPIDPTGLDRYPLQVAIDNQSTSCFNIIIKVAYKVDSVFSKEFKKFVPILEKKDARGWRAIEHALKYWPQVAFNTLPLATFDHFNENSIEEYIRFAMRNNLLSSIYFLRSFCGKFEAIEKQIFVLETIMEEFLDLEDCNSEISEIFFTQILMDYNDLFSNYRNMVDGTVEFYSGLYLKAVKKNCIVFMSSSAIFNLVFGKLEEFNDVILSEEGYFSKLKTYKEIFIGHLENKKMGSADYLSRWFRDVQNEFLKTSSILELDWTADPKTVGVPTFLSPGIPKTFDFYRAINIFFDTRFIPNDSLRQKLQEVTNLTIDELPDYLYGNIPLAFPIALLKPELLSELYEKKSKMFHKSLEIAGKASALDLIACYAPNAFEAVSLKIESIKQKELAFKSALKFIFSNNCRSADEVKMETIRFCSKKFLKSKITASFVKTDTKWTLFSKIFYGQNEETMRSVVESALNVKNYDFAYKAIIMKNLKIDYDVLLKFVYSASDNFEKTKKGLECISDLMDLNLVNNEGASRDGIKMLHDKLIQLLKHNSEYELLRILIPRLWLSIGINEKIETTVEISLFTYLLEIQNESSCKLLTTLIRTFNDSLIITDKDMEIINFIEESLKSEFKIFVQFANYKYNNKN